MELPQIQLGQRGTMNGGVAIRGVEDLPLPAGRFDEERQPGVADLPDHRHPSERSGIVKAVAFRVIRATRDQRFDQCREMSGIHLIVGVHLHADVRTVAQGLEVPGEHGATHAAIDLVNQEPDAGIGNGVHSLRRLIRARVVDDDDGIDPARDSVQHLLDRPGGSIRRDDDRDSQSLGTDHQIDTEATTAPALSSPGCSRRGRRNRIATRGANSDRSDAR